MLVEKINNKARDILGQVVFPTEPWKADPLENKAGASSFESLHGSTVGCGQL